METLLLILGGTLITVAAMAVTSIWSGFVLTKLWIWFIVPIFHLPVLTIVPAIGLCIVVSYLTTQAPAAKDERDGKEKATDIFSYGLIYPTLMLALGWAVHLFM